MNSTNSASVSILNAALCRRPKPIVEDGLPLLSRRPHTVAP